MTSIKYKSAAIKTTPTDGSGRFTALLAAYGPPADWQNEIFDFPAFKESILEWKLRGVRPPILFNHSANEPTSKIGEFVSLQEIPSGLLVEGQLNLKNPLALEVYESMLNGSLDSLSVGFEYVSTYMTDDIRHISKALLIEGSVVTMPAEPRAQILAVKSRSTNDERVAEGLTPIKGLRAVDQRAATCGICKTKSTVDRYAPVPGGSTRWSITPCCGQLLGWSKRNISTRQHVLEMSKIRMFLENAALKARNRDADLVKQRDQLDTATAQNGDTIRLGDTVAYWLGKTEVHGIVDGISEDGIYCSRSRGHRHDLVAPDDVVRVVSTGEVRGNVDPTSENAELAGQLEELVRSVREEKAREEAAIRPFLDANEALLAGPIDWSAQAEREEELRIRELAELQRRDDERASEAESERVRDLVDRTRDWHGDAYWESVGSTPDLTERAPANLDERIHITDATFEPEPSFRVPVLPNVDTTYRVVDEPDASTLPVASTPENREQEVQE